MLPSMETATTSVFRAGSGATPPALTGRTAEQAVLRRCLAGVSNGEAPPHDVVLLGPRGNGKTALLRWFESACAQNEPAVDVAWLTPAALRDPSALLDALAPRRRLANHDTAWTSTRTRLPPRSPKASVIHTSSSSGAMRCGDDT